MALGKKTGGGSRKGKVNKFTKTAKEAFEFAFDELGGANGLAAWAKDPANQTEFYKIFARLLPKPVEVSGKDGEPFSIKISIK